MRIEVVKGVEGKALYVDDIRICGPKPWGGGTIIACFEVDVDTLKDIVLTEVEDENKR